MFLPLILALFVSFFSRAELVDRVVAVVSDRPILQSDVNSLLSQFKKTPNLASFYGIKGQDVNYDKVLSLLLNEAIIKHSLKELNAQVSEGEVQKQIHSIAGQNKIPVSQLKQSLQREGISFDAYQRNIQMQLERKALFDRELRSSASNVSEAELRADFEKIAQKEWKLLLWAKKNSSNAKDEMNAALRDFKARKLSLSEIQRKHSLDDLGWVDIKSLNKTFQAAIAKLGPRSASETVTIGDVIHVIFVEDIRKGSDEQFQAMKEQLLQRRQGENLEELFQSWIDRKKKEIQVVINK